MIGRYEREKRAEEREVAASKYNVNVSDSQLAIKRGDNFVVFNPQEDLFLFCHVQTKAEFTEAWGGVPTRDRDAEIELTERIYAVGYRVCDVYSVLQPNGRTMDVHVAMALLTLTDEEWGQMRDIGWDPAGYLAGKHPSKRETIVLLRPNVIRPTMITVEKISQRLLEVIGNR